MGKNLRRPLKGPFLRNDFSYLTIRGFLIQENNLDWLLAETKHPSPETLARPLENSVWPFSDPFFPR